MCVEGTAPDSEGCEDPGLWYNSTIRHAKTSPGLLHPAHGLLK
jgi:hypothetical protein